MFLHKKHLDTSEILENLNQKEDNRKTLLKRVLLANTVLVAFNLSLFLSDYKANAHVDENVNKPLNINKAIERNISVCSTKYQKKDPDEIIIAVIDRGFFLGNDFFQGRTIDLPVGKSIVKYSSNSSDTIGIHGTQVVSKAIIELNKSRDNENIKIMPIDIDLCGNIVDSIKYAVDNGAKVINISLKLQDVSRSLYNQIQSMVNYAHSKNVIIVTSAGNDGPNISDSYLSVCDHVVCVAAKDADFSNRGEFVDFSGKGIAVKVIDVDGNEMFVDGTSFVAPYYSASVAQLINLIRKTDPSISIDCINQDQVVQIMATSISPNLKRDFQNGWGEFSLKNLKNLSLPSIRNIEPPHLMLFKTSSKYDNNTLKLSFKVDGFGKLDTTSAKLSILGTTINNEIVKEKEIEFSEWDNNFSSEISLQDGHYTLKVDGIMDSNGRILQTQRDFVKDTSPATCDISYIIGDNADKTNCVLLKGQVSDFSGVENVYIYQKYGVEEKLLDSFDFANLSKLDLVHQFNTLIDSKKLDDGESVIIIKSTDGVGNQVSINYKLVKSGGKVISVDYMNKKIDIK